MSARASMMSRHTPVPTSTTDWCISALTFSFSTRLPCAISSVWMCERRSNALGIDGLVLLLDPDRERRRLHGRPLSSGAQRRSSGAGGSWALATANRATASTIQAKFSTPTECGSASGAGFMKSMA